MISELPSDGPPDYTAPQGSLARDIRGVLWEQLAAGGGSYWGVFSAHGARTGVLWSQSGLQIDHSASIGPIAIPPVDLETNIDYLTIFELYYPILLYGLVLPILVPSSGGDLKIRCGLYDCQVKNFTTHPRRLVHERAEFRYEVAGFPIGVEQPVLIPFADGGEPILLRPQRLFIRVLYGSTDIAALAAPCRRVMDYGETNNFRADKHASYGPTGYFDYSSTSLFQNEYPNSNFGTRPGGTTSPEQIDWGLLGEVYR